ncbi:TetR/AcrR family transcriptional regulator [Oleiagrimonas soli]|uniref:AcrR family transcriptional regulator n=1 Tax=Oleiagrimonas soli TaxID=1543381 RepID=A0A099CYG3_9GAMM|nr:TetR/AcrR family transcriptional regulator [Oleiagrimonas soli]KGI78647.1 TetR family transcriptional regulator [Oleiagrimonas soli]MBB6184049.1 AcrR family transcriptional regulator [Oleiagrimonas soli]
MTTSIPRKRRRTRGAGRPSGDDRDLREALLDAAIQRFVRVGIGAASLRSIADAAGVTPAMLHYYFGDKERLVQAMIGERLLPALAKVQERLQEAGDDPAKLIGGFVRGLGEVIRTHPWLPPLWVREVLCEGGALRALLVHELAPKMPHMLAERLAAAQRAGRLPAHLDPRLLVVSLVGLTLFPAAGAPIWEQIFNLEASTSDVLAEHALGLLSQGLQLDFGGVA